MAIQIKRFDGLVLIEACFSEDDPYIRQI